MTGHVTLPCEAHIFIFIMIGHGQLVQWLNARLAC